MSEHLKPGVYVSPHQTLEDLASVLRDQDDRMAIVVGEVGIGFAFDESPERERRRYEVLGDELYRMDVRLPISEINGGVVPK